MDTPDTPVWRLSRPAVGILALVLLWAGGCASSGPEAPVFSISSAERPFLIDPISGYPLTLSATEADQVKGLYSRLVSGGDPKIVARDAESLAAASPSLLAAQVVRAQAHFVAGAAGLAADVVEPVLEELPDYLAAALLAARLDENASRVLEAHDRYSSVENSSRLAAERAQALRPRAMEIIAGRFDDALTRGRFDDAESALDRLALYGLGELPQLEAKQRLLSATGDEEGELEVIRQLTEVSEDPYYDRRRGELELEYGDVRSGLEIFERLATLDPDDVELAEGLARAKFAWGLELLPPEVKALGRRGELVRAELASLLYWLFPDVRYSAVDDPPIAADILDHPKQREILRVLDLDLMGVDRALHRFRPADPATRSDALQALLGLLMAAEPPLGCLASEARRGASSHSERWVCARSAECGLIPEALACLPAATLAGGEALELVRLAQELTAVR
ncbi:MAG: hypothetical protein AAFY88_04750 [Acidobacteriota bacterium]